MFNSRYIFGKHIKGGWGWVSGNKNVTQTLWGGRGVGDVWWRVINPDSNIQISKWGTRSWTTHSASSLYFPNALSTDIQSILGLVGISAIYVCCFPITLCDDWLAGDGRKHLLSNGAPKVNKSSRIPIPPDHGSIPKTSQECKTGIWSFCISI